MDDTTPSAPSLTPEETTLLLLVAQGHAAQTVARSLALSESTLRRRLTIIQRKLGANSRINAVYLGTKKGYI